MSYVTGSHAFKVGFSDTWASDGRARPTRTTSAHDVPVQQRHPEPAHACTACRPAASRSSRGRSASTRRIAGRSTAGRSTAASATTASAAAIPNSTGGPAPLQPTRDYTFAAVTSMSLHDVTPRARRVPTTCSATARPRSRSALGKYVIGVSTIGNPAGVSTTTTRNWNDLIFPVGDPRRGNFNPDCDLLNSAANGECSHCRDSLRPADVDCGSSTRTPASAGATGLQLGVLDERAARAGAAPRHRRRLLPPLVRQLPGHADNPGLTAADFDPYSVTAPLDAGCPMVAAIRSTGSTTSTRRRSGRARPTRRWPATSASRPRHWNGVDFSANARLQNGVMLQGGVSTGRTTTDNCDVIGQRSGSRCSAV